MSSAITGKKKPTTPGIRHAVKFKEETLSKCPPLLKFKIKGQKNKAGRNNTGKITVRHKGGGSKKKYRYLSFTEQLPLDIGMPLKGLVCSLEYDPYRSAFIAAVKYDTKNFFFYVLAPAGIKTGDTLLYTSVDNPKSLLSWGTPQKLKNFPAGTPIYNVAMHASGAGKISRSAGTFSTLLKSVFGEESDSKMVTLKLGSGEIMEISKEAVGYFGIVSNQPHNITVLGKAGASRWLGKRPSVRGVAMNPVDHPNGGGEGKKSGRSLSPWGKYSKAGKTSKSKNPRIILKRSTLVKKNKNL